MLLAALHILLALVAAFLLFGTLLNFSKHPHWFVRIWDFPRLMTALLATAIAVPYAIWFRDRWYDWALLAGLAFVVARQLYMIFPYTPVARKVVKRASGTPDRGRRLRLAISNAEMENRQFDRWLRVMREADPDVIVALEVDSAWDEGLRPLEGGGPGQYPHVVRQIQDNYYGMILFSRLKLQEVEVKFLVQDDIPSIHATLVLRDGQRVTLHALHPRPPEPINDQDSAPRDAELVIMGKQIHDHQRAEPTIVCGDLNDVAWSYTTQLFLRLSKLLDPRKGRGFYNTFNAKSRLFRFPLDHVFHSDEFKLIELRRLGHVGSDHFPVLIELSCEPESAPHDQGEPRERAGDREEAEEILGEQAEREREGKEHGHVSSGRGGAA
jgi:endonuclease/exonuclease/phosphatase (EEP) superfamily protein YafD